MHNLNELFCLNDRIVNFYIVNFDKKVHMIDKLKCHAERTKRTISV